MEHDLEKKKKIPRTDLWCVVTDKRQAVDDSSVLQLSLLFSSLKFKEVSPKAGLWITSNHTDMKRGIH